MITVTIKINGKTLACRSAWRLDTPRGSDSDPYKYKVDTGKVIKHYPADGVVSLAKQLLDTIKE